MLLADFVGDGFLSFMLVGGILVLAMRKLSRKIDSDGQVKKAAQDGIVCLSGRIFKK